MPPRHLDPTLHVHAIGPLLVCVWLDAPRVSQLRILRREMLALRGAAASPGPLFANLILSGTPRFEEAVREETMQLMRDSQGYRAAAHVVELPGLAGVATRSFISTALLLARPGLPNKVFSAVGPAAAWLAPRAAGWPDLTEARLRDVIESARPASHSRGAAL